VRFFERHKDSLLIHKDSLLIEMADSFGCLLAVWNAQCYRYLSFDWVISSLRHCHIKLHYCLIMTALQLSLLQFQDGV